MRTALLTLLCIPAFAVGPRPGSLMLDGKWEFRFAADDRGTAEGWFGEGVAYEQKLTVPGGWEAQGVGGATDKMNHHAVGVGWYRRSFTLPRAWEEKRVWLVLGGVHRRAKVWVDGQPVGEHLGYPVAGRFEVTEALGGRQAGPVAHGATPACHVLTLAVDSRRHPDDPLAGAFDLLDYMDVDWGGIFESVWLEATGDAWLEDAFVIADPAAKRAQVEVTLGGKAEGVTLRWAVRGQVSGAVTNPTRLDIPLPNAPHWTPEAPNLLALDLALMRGGQVLDRRTVRFGLQRLEVRGADFCLNGDRFFLRGYGDDHTFPRDITGPTSVAGWREYLLRRKAFGFNGVRHHSTMLPESYLAAADEVGVFVQPELPIAYQPFYDRATPEGRELYHKVWAEYIRQMRNHPSVFGWCMGNEMYQGLDMSPALYDAAKALDPTRPVIDTDGCSVTERRTLDYLSVQFNEFSEGAVAWGRARGKHQIAAPPRPVLVHEMGNISVLPDPGDIPQYDGAVRPFWLEQMRDAVAKQGLQGQLPAMLSASRKLQASLLKLNFESARLSPEIDGHHQWLFRDYWTQSTGFVNQFDQARALTPETARQFNSPAVLLWDREGCNFRTGGGLPLRVFLSDFRPASAPALRVVRVRLADHEVTLAPPANAGTRGLVGPWTGSIPLPAPEVPRKFTVEARAGNVRNTWAVWVFPETVAGALPWTEGTPATRVGGRDARPTRPEVLVKSRLTGKLLAQLARGARVVLTDDSGVFPTLTASFKPAWWKGDDTADHSFGTLFTDHPALRGFPHDGYGDLQAYGLLAGRRVVMMDELPVRIDPVIWCLDVPWRMRRKGYLFEARVGAGRLLVSTMNLSARSREADPAAECMLESLVRYAASDEFRPKARLPLAWLRARVAGFAAVDTSQWVEGYASGAVSTEASKEWHSHREDNLTVYAVRQTDGAQRVSWRTAQVPAIWPHKTVTFAWTGGIGWSSEPGGGHFTLWLNGKPLLDFPFVTDSAHWQPPDGAVSLDYLFRRRLGVDTFGVFLLTVPAELVGAGQSAELAVTATAQGSQRWVSLVPYTDTVAEEGAE